MVVYILNSALWRQRYVDLCEVKNTKFQDSQDYLERPCLKKRGGDPNRKQLIVSI